MRKRVQGYRSIWIKNYGKIPLDEFGRSYEIHHIDGDTTNNDISNLKCVSIKDHFDIHYSQGDFEAAIIIADRLNLSKKELDHLRLSGLSKKQIQCPHCFKVGGEPAMKRWHFDNCFILNKNKYIQKKYKCKYCNDEIGGKGNLIQHEKSCSGVSRNKDCSKPKVNTINNLFKLFTCPHCNKTGRNAMLRWHFDNCLLKPDNEHHKRPYRKK